MGSAVVAAGRYVEIGPDGRPAACRGGDRSQRSRRALARARTDRRSLTEIADNLSRARHLIERDGRPSGPATANRQADTPDIHGQVMHTLYVATRNGCRTRWVCNGAAAPTGGRHPPTTTMAERPTTLEITEAQGMIARFSGFEQLAAAYMFGQPLPSADPGQRRAVAQAAAGNSLGCLEVQAHRTLAANPDPADLVRIARVQALITSTTSVITEAAATRAISTTM